MDNKMADYLQERIHHLRLHLDKLRQNRREEIENISQIDDELRVAQTYLTQYPPNDSFEYNNLCNYVADYDKSITSLVQQSETENEIIISGSYILSGTASYYTDHYPEVLPGLLKEIDILRQNLNDKNIVYEELNKHNKIIADLFLSAWQNLEIPAIDPARGPSFLMRESITHFFHHFAPDKLVEAKNWWKPYDERTRITRSHRIKFIFEEQIIDTRKSNLVELQLKELENLYHKLNRAHEQKPLDVNYVKPILYEAQDLLKSLLQVIKRPIYCA